MQKRQHPLFHTANHTIHNSISIRMIHLCSTRAKRITSHQTNWVLCDGLSASIHGKWFGQHEFYTECMMAKMYIVCIHLSYHFWLVRLSKAVDHRNKSTPQMAHSLHKILSFSPKRNMSYIITFTSNGDRHVCVCVWFIVVVTVITASHQVFFRNYYSFAMLWICFVFVNSVIPLQIFDNIHDIVTMAITFFSWACIKQMAGIIF